MNSCLLISLSLLGFASVANGYQCSLHARKMGCFRDQGGSARLMVSGHKFSKTMKRSDWSGNGWNLHLQKLLCECLKRAEKEGRRYVGLENYHECWIGNLDQIPNIDNRRAKNTNCWSEGPAWNECTDAKHYCVGIQWHMEVYELVSSSVAIVPETEEPTVKIRTIKPFYGKRPPPMIPQPPPRLPPPPPKRF